MALKIFSKRAAQNAITALVLAANILNDLWFNFLIKQRNKINFFENGRHRVKRTSRTTRLSSPARMTFYGFYRVSEKKIGQGTRCHLSFISRARIAHKPTVIVAKIPEKETQRKGKREGRREGGERGSRAYIAEFIIEKRTAYK